MLSIIFFVSITFSFYTKQTYAVTPDGYTLYEVDTYAKLKSAITDSSNVKKYILLTADIIYGFPNGATVNSGGTSANKTVEPLYFSSDTIIDGSGLSGNEKRSLLFGYTGTDGYYAYASPLRTITPSINVTYKNLKFGNSTYKNSTNAGILYPYTEQGTNLNITLNIVNVDYDISGTNGSPFNSYYADGNTIHFSGTNNFTMLNTSSGSYFSTGYKNIIFDDSSITNIKVASGATESVFAGEQGVGALNVELGANSYVSLINGKNSLLTSSSTNITIGTNSNFEYNLVPGGGNASYSYLNTNSSSTTNISVANNSKASFESTKSNMLSWGLNGTTSLNVTSPKSVLFSKNSTNTNSTLFTGNSLIVNRLDNIREYDYQSSMLRLGESKTTDYTLFKSGDSKTISSSSTTGKSVWIYEPQIKTEELLTSSSVAADQSDLNISEPYSTEDYDIFQTNYKVSADSLNTGGSMTSEGSQSSVENATEDKLIADVSLTDNFTYTVNNLLAQTYYVYGQINVNKTYTSSAVGDFSTTSTSKWVEVSQVIEKGIFVEFPKNIDFKSKIIGDYQSESYKIVNHSNTPVTVSVSTLTEIQSSFSLVNKIEKDSKHASTLNLNINSPSNPAISLINLNDIDTNIAISLSSYTDSTKNFASFYLSGNYSGPLDGEQNGSYSLTFSIQD